MKDLVVRKFVLYSWRTHLNKVRRHACMFWRSPISFLYAGFSIEILLYVFLSRSQSTFPSLTASGKSSLSLSNCSYFMFSDLPFITIPNVFFASLRLCGLSQAYKKSAGKALALRCGFQVTQNVEQTPSKINAHSPARVHCLLSSENSPASLHNLDKVFGGCHSR